MIGAPFIVRKSVAQSNYWPYGDALLRPLKDRRAVLCACFDDEDPFLSTNVDCIIQSWPRSERSPGGDFVGAGDGDHLINHPNHRLHLLRVHQDNNNLNSYAQRIRFTTSDHPDHSHRDSGVSHKAEEDGHGDPDGLRQVCRKGHLYQCTHLPCLHLQGGFWDAEGLCALR